MVRRYGEPVEVRPAGDAGLRAASQDGVVPGCFLWRGRLYVVRDVLGHWRERRAWWTAAAAMGVHGAGPDGGTAVALGVEHEVWRVEAGCGRDYGTGVFDLCHDVATGGEAAADVPAAASTAAVSAWRLLCVAD